MKLNEKENAIMTFWAVYEGEISAGSGRPQNQAFVEIRFVDIFDKRNGWLGDRLQNIEK
jgi:hypothetical protein|tara:strand:- start:177 stop:353 length:177 start_codon:yes stop_codon:yes gene_type:complete